MSSFILFMSIAFSCNKYIPFDLSYDSANSCLFSIGILGQNLGYLEIDPSSFACTATPLNVTDVCLYSSHILLFVLFIYINILLKFVSLSSYDPTTRTIYIVLSNNDVCI
jgi:hypothetical protein